jgi:hypothetical protein
MNEASLTRLVHFSKIYRRSLMNRLAAVAVVALLLTACASTKLGNEGELSSLAQSWQQSRYVLNPSGASGKMTSQSLAINSSGEPIIALVEDTTTVNGDGVYVFKQDLTNGFWNSVGTGGLVSLFNSTTIDPDYLTTSVAIDKSNNPVIAWYEGYPGGRLKVKRWTGSNWQAVGGVIAQDSQTTGMFPSIAINSSNQPVIAYVVSNPSQLYVKKWTGSAWQQIGAGVVGDGGLSSFPSLALDSTDNPVVAYYHGGTTTSPYGVRVSRWTGSTWQVYGSSFRRGDGGITYFPKLTLIANKPVVTWYENGLSGSGQGFNVYVNRWTGTAWQQLGGILDITGTNDTMSSTISVLNSQPIVAWVECNRTPDAQGIYRAFVYVKQWDNIAKTWNLVGGQAASGSNGFNCSQQGFSIGFVANQQNGNLTTTYGTYSLIYTSMYK